jgi:hypothetical protein
MCRRVYGPAPLRRTNELRFRGFSRVEREKVAEGRMGVSYARRTIAATPAGVESWCHVILGSSTPGYLPRRLPASSAVRECACIRVTPNESEGPGARVAARVAARWTMLTQRPALLWRSSRPRAASMHGHSDHRRDDPNDALDAARTRNGLASDGSHSRHPLVPNPVMKGLPR